ncbi:protein MpGH17.15 [Marchantia polymorpha subsp. ruderalis]|uniref:glucan endo-1,3-beta-D-glucosidase n=2 Tax=Marchantia polymorpha TaxID=3197 RepID=A0A176WAE4_MARPO|nr:hypothetical protein AXG93_1112s1360 [Marchantia polymorpha subsp. ruderalis]PTQ32001.1 hypothetical protein MARPO_0104s0030 [Marchantia polymorpha]BBN13044.1 hypothetical protein Mp_6g00360 [Marchantia polymorpha subsp. ruderalis]|eukprot:PTQ32001.1 hypothetical protein MARPO_0104s0030 [Marchantia polymorpha]
MAISSPMRTISAVFILSMLVLDASAIGVNYGQIADDLPTPAAVRQLVETTTITKLKLFDTNPAVLTAFAGSPIEFVVAAGNDQIVPLANSSAVALQWVQANVAAYPTTNITVISLGNEVLAYAGDAATFLLPALQNLHAALVTLKLDHRVKVTTPHAMSILSASEPPSAGVFGTWEGSIIVPMLEFMARTASPLTVNAYPYYAYINSPNVSLNYCLFQPTADEVKFDNATLLNYTSMFDAQVDALYHALAKEGFNNVSVAVGETGWPSKGDPFVKGPSMVDARLFNANLIKHLASGVGTPVKPGVVPDTYIFALFNENQKPGPSYERNFGLFYPNGSMVYDSGVMPTPTPV